MGNSGEAIGQTTTPGKRPYSKILVDGGDPQETVRIQQLIGFVDGQTTNPSLIAKNPEVMHLVSLHNDYDSLILERRVSAWQG